MKYKSFRVLDENGNYLALFYTDFHPRQEKEMVLG